MSETRSLSLGRHGESEWEALRASYLLVPEKGVIAVFADSPEVRGELRRRLESLGAPVGQLAPGLDLLGRIQALAEGAERPPVAWIEAPTSDGDITWFEGLAALNRGRDMLWDRGGVVVVIAGPRKLNEWMRSRAPDLSSIVQPVLMLDDTLEPLIEPSGPLCWLHLSDLHIGNGRWEQDHVLRSLVRDLPGLLEQVERKPQLLFVTGDVANRGIAAEYEGAQRLFDELCKLLGISPREHLFLVPGNHDVDRGSISKSAGLMARAFEGMGEDEFRTAIGDLVGTPADFELFGRRLSAWCQFTGRLLGPGRHVSIDRPWRSDVVDVSGVAVGIASMCSVWLSGPDDAKGRLVVGQRQVQMLIDELDSAGAELRIALLHHPVGWLRELEERYIEALLHDEFDVVLHGHVHHPKAGSFIHGMRSTVQIGAGAAYAGLGQDRFHGFTVAQLDPEREQIDVDAFTWTTRTNHWHIDAGFHRDAPRGRLTLPMQLARLRGRSRSQPARPDELVSRLRRAVVSVYGSQSFIGLPDEAPKRPTNLLDVFVPLDLRDRRGTGDEARHQLGELTERWLRVHSEGETAPRAVVLGDPGSGKTTLTRYLAVTAAEDSAGLVPILLAVRDWDPESFRGSLLSQMQRHTAAMLSVRTDDSALEELCEQGRLLLLIDGIDEAGLREREALRNQLHGFEAAWPRVTIISTSRSVGYDEAALDPGRFEHLTLEPFDDDRLREFIRRWCAVAEPNHAAERRRRETELWAALKAEPRAKELGRNPLLATLLALIHFHRAQLPGDRALLYRLCVETLVITWPAACGRELSELPGYRQMVLLEDLALWMQLHRSDDVDAREQRGIVISGVQLERRMFELLEGPFQNLDEGHRREFANKWRRWLVRASGLIQEQQHDRYGFLHLSLMEYLAGQAVWREQVRHGYDQVARFVAERHVKTNWRETLALMLGSHNNDRALGDEIMRALLAVEPRTWTTLTFALSLLREDIELDPALRAELLNAVSAGALPTDVPIEHMLYEWPRARVCIADTQRFGRKHGQAIREWYEAAMAHRSGEELASVLVVLPWGVEVSSAMRERDDEDLGLTALLDLGKLNPWGKWAADRARPNTWLSWVLSTPMAGVVGRGLDAVAGWGPAACWVLGLLRRTQWVGEAIVDASSTLRAVSGGEGIGVPVGLKWSGGFGSVHCHVAPLYIFRGIASARDFTLDFARDSRLVSSVVEEYFAQNYAQKFKRYLTLSSALKFPQEFEQYFNRDSLRNFTLFLIRELATDLVKDMAHIFAANFGDDLVAHLELARETGHSTFTRPATSPGLPTQEQLLMTRVADAHSGLFLTTPNQPAFDIAAARIQNRCIHTYFEFLIQNTAMRLRHAPVTPEQQAVFLALGLAQYQTTWSWPPGPTWHAWFTAPAPEYWLAAYVWHLCWAVGDPTNPEHLANAEAALDRGDWPELVAELRQFKVIAPPPPEVRALFDGWTED